MTLLLLFPVKRYVHLPSQKRLAYDVRHSHFPVTASDQAERPKSSLLSQNSLRSQWNS